MIQYRNSLFVLSVLLLSLCGCPGSSGNVGWVDGVVTLDGETIEGATVRFYPETGRASSGKTDESGYYELRYTRSEMGAVIGKHKVTITAEAAATGGYEQEDKKDARARVASIPKKYREPEKTELVKTVESGSNTIDLELTSK